MREDRGNMARALQAFRDGKGDRWDFAGAMLVADGLDDMRKLRQYVEAAFGVKGGKAGG